MRKFLERPRDDLSKWKLISDKELQRRADMLPVDPPFWKQFKKHQKVCLVLGARLKRLAIFNETGTGKTFLSLGLMKYFKRTGDTSCNLILVPNKINKDEWGTEGFDKHAPSMKYVVLRGSSANKWQQIEDNPDVDAFIETYMGFVRMCCDLKKVAKRGKAAKNKLVPNVTKVRKLAKLFDGVYCDESTYLANRAKLPYRLVNQLSKTANAFFILTATPFGRDVTMAWAQMYLVDRGETLGETLTLFRAAFFEEKENFFGGATYKLKPDGKMMVSKFLDHGSICYPADEADLPQLSRVPRYVNLAVDAETYYDQAKTQIMKARGNMREMKNAFLRMRQISSGFIGYRDDEDGEKAKFVFETNPKLELLESIVREIPEHQKGIIFHDFIYSAKVITDMLEDVGVGFTVLNGSTKDGAAARYAFKHNKKTQYIVLSNSAGGYGLNLQNAKYGIYYESPVGAILRKQTEKRFDRQYSLHKKVFLMDLIVRGTVDQTILDFHQEGRDLWKAVLNTGNPNMFLR